MKTYIDVPTQFQLAGPKKSGLRLAFVDQLWIQYRFGAFRFTTRMHLLTIQREAEIPRHKDMWNAK
jgi:hypothetical protein